MVRASVRAALLLSMKVVGVCEPVQILSGSAMRQTFTGDQMDALRWGVSTSTWREWTNRSSQPAHIVVDFTASLRAST